MAEGVMISFRGPKFQGSAGAVDEGVWGTWQVRGCLGCLLGRPSPKENSSRVTLLRVRATTLRDELGRTRKAQSTDDRFWKLSGWYRVSNIAQHLTSGHPGDLT